MTAAILAQRDHVSDGVADRNFYVGCEQNTAQADVPRQSDGEDLAGFKPHNPKGQVQLKAGDPASLNDAHLAKLDAFPSSGQ
ncbi:MAG TPA: hypothetical protein VEU11_04150 [Terriglobales bacterium]|nr:hypothetical protein [Terriglobales bacterium]